MKTTTGGPRAGAWRVDDDGDDALYYSDDPGDFAATVYASGGWSVYPPDAVRPDGIMVALWAEGPETGAEGRTKALAALRERGVDTSAAEPAQDTPAAEAPTATPTTPAPDAGAAGPGALSRAALDRLVRESLGDDHRIVRFTTSVRQPVIIEDDVPDPVVVPSAEDVVDGYIASQPQRTERRLVPWDRVLALARGCHDYSGGHRGAEAEAYHHGIDTVANVLGAAAEGRDDYQTRIVEAIGRDATQAAPAGPLLRAAVEAKLHQTDDAMVWAREMDRIVRANGGWSAMDVDWLHTWLANAIVAGQDVARWRREAEEREAAETPEARSARLRGLAEARGWRASFGCWYDGTNGQSMAWVWADAQETVLARLPDGATLDDALAVALGEPGTAEVARLTAEVARLAAALDAVDHIRSCNESQERVLRDVIAAVGAENNIDRLAERVSVRVGRLTAERDAARDAAADAQAEVARLTAALAEAKGERDEDIVEGYIASQPQRTGRRLVPDTLDAVTRLADDLDCEPDPAQVVAAVRALRRERDLLSGWQAGAREGMGVRRG